MSDENPTLECWKCGDRTKATAKRCNSCGSVNVRRKSMIYWFGFLGVITLPLPYYLYPTILELGLPQPGEIFTTTIVWVLFILPFFFMLFAYGSHLEREDTLRSEESTGA